MKKKKTVGKAKKVEPTTVNGRRYFHNIPHEDPRHAARVFFSKTDMDDLAVMSMIDDKKPEVRNAALNELARRGWEQFWDRKSGGWTWRHVQFRQ